MKLMLFAMFITVALNGFTNAADKQSQDEVPPEARMVPAIRKGGETVGYTLEDVAPGSIYAKLGLKKNDILKSVNGEKIDNPNKAMDLYNSLKSNKKTKVVVERDGHELVFTLQAGKN